MKNIILSSLVLASLFVGCKSSGGICCDSEFEEQIEQEQAEVFLAPVAVLDNRTSEDETLFFFSCANSYDRDENNQSIVRCDWNITGYGDGISSSILEANGTEVNTSRYFDSMTESITVELTVTDNEGETNITTKQFDVMFY